MIGTASGKNEKFVRDLGANEFVDYTRQPFEEVVKDVDVVFDVLKQQARQWQLTQPPTASLVPHYGTK